MNIFITNSSGKKIAVGLHRPVGEDVHSLAVLLPGFLDSKDYAHLVKLGGELSKVGFTALRLDPTGTWASEGNISEYSVSQYLKDVSSVISSMKRKAEYVQTVVIGHSLGGMIALLYADQENDVDAVVGIMFPIQIAQYSQWKEKLIDWEKTGYKISDREIPDNLSEQREYKVPYSYIEDSRQYNVLKDIDDLHIPQLFVAAENDEGISLGEIQEVFTKANEPKKFVLVQGATHRYWNKVKHLQKVNKEVITFLEEYSLI